MNKFKLLFLLALLTTSANSYATGFYVGVDGLDVNATHKARDFPGPDSNATHDKNKLGYGANAGFRFDLLNLLASAELFYDNLNTSTSNFNTSTSTGNQVKIKDRYGAKINAGFAIFPRITPFLTYGLTEVRSNNDTLSISTDKSKLTSLYGAGILVDLPLGISAKISYDYQQFAIPYAGEGYKIRTRLGVTKLGVVYNF